MTDDDLVFKALADPTRRTLLDALFAQDGQNQTELEQVVREHTEMTRFGVAKHLRLLEDAQLITTRKEGRTRRYFLNAVPIQAIHDRWIDKYTAARASALLDLKKALENQT
ncbi:ArsR/SmtB family transcription factor [Aeromicrobium sp. CTD01-1L150]|uniref:ArsR/SmtB family transcription factor n=1 Tax=Aeromicrobium sp. CTD01-1L150 TaxID=3341830 RepID=UPI0035BF5807